MAGTAPSRIVTERRYRLTSTFTFTTGSTKEPPKLCSVARTANKVYRGRAFEFLDACKIKRKPVIKLVLCGPHRTVLRCVWEGTQAVLNKLQEHLGKVVQSKEYHAAKRAFNVEIGFDPMESFLVTVVVEPVAVKQPGVAVRKRSSSPSLSEPLQAKRHRSSSSEEGDSVVPEGRPESDNVAAAGKFTTSPTPPPLDKETERSLFGSSPQAILGPQLIPESNAEHSRAIPPTAPVAAARRTPLFLEDPSESEDEKENQPIGSSGSASSPGKRGRSTTGSLINTDVSSRRPERSAESCALPYKTIKSRGRVSSLKITICGGAQEVKQESEPVVTNALVAQPAEPSAFTFVKDEFAHVDVFGTGSLLSDSATPLATNTVPSLLCTAGNRADWTLGEGSAAHSKPAGTLLRDPWT
ncbi:uncharacterized protein C8Q71DRAFT_276156 [Rhodofomes roseus]|uniref:Uncharacterized protein n=1 Tax=Rhodofomes roseus TaxID=34475 RepID=A0ABQ8K4V4_9APHY|nr:uncharacterized protein C8Q71DRAFT_276156 [Rhodofomes roseus]KAH9831992.1 hypothetical protein C8Q71DRAFT_276156 [Rhodofomes roseus]